MCAGARSSDCDRFVVKSGLRLHSFRMINSAGLAGLRRCFEPAAFRSGQFVVNLTLV